MKLLRGVRQDRINRSRAGGATPDEPPNPPSWRSRKAKVMWRRLALSLFDAGVLSEWDRCSSFLTWREAQELADRATGIG